VDQTGHDRTGPQKIGERSQRAGHHSAFGDGFEVGPGRRDQALRAVREDEAQLDVAVPRHRAHDGQLLALEGMVRSSDPDRRWKVPDVGSVSPTPSTRSTTRLL